MPLNNPNAVDNLIPVKKGEVRNPTGRPKGASVVAELKKLAEGRIKIKETGRTHTRAKAVAMTILEQAIKGNPKFCQMVLDRIDGKATEPESEHGGLNPLDNIEISITFSDKVDNE